MIRNNLDGRSASEDSNINQRWMTPNVVAVATGSFPAKPQNADKLSLQIKKTNDFGLAYLLDKPI